MAKNLQTQCNPNKNFNGVFPEIEKLFPFNPLDFKSFDLPEEHQITHLPLIGVLLIILDEERELEQLLQVGPPFTSEDASSL